MGPRKHVLGGDAHWRHLANTTEPCAAAMLATCYNYFQFSNAIQGANAWTLWSSPLALCYSAAEYCAPGWSHSAHTGLVDVQLNAIMRLISGTIRPLPWLPVLANIEPPLEGGLEGRPPQSQPSWWRKQTTVAHDSWPIQHDILYHHHKNVIQESTVARFLFNRHHNSVEERLEFSASVVNSHLVDDPINLPRQQWSLLNRFSTAQGHCGACRKRWRQVDSDLCACGEP